MTFSLLLPMLIVALLIGGMGVAILGSVKVSLAKRLQIDEARVGGLISLFGFTLIPVILTAGFLTDLVGRQVVMIGGSILVATSLLLLAYARNYLTALTAVVLLSAGWALLINVSNVLTPLAFPGSLTYATNLANVFFGIGAFLTPLLVALLIRTTSFPLAVLFLGGFSLLAGAFALGVDFAVPTPAASPSGAASQPELSDLLQNPILWLCGFALFFYGPLEASMGGWATTYLGEQGVGEGTAASLLSAFWLTFMGSRLVTALTTAWLMAKTPPVLPEGWESVFILVLALACVGVWTGAVLGRGRFTAMSMVIAAGIVFGPIFPTIMAILLGSFDSALHGRAVGMLFAIGGIGWTIIPMLIGAYAQRTSLRRGFSVAVGAAVGLSVVAMILFLYMRAGAS